jgi:hypothetical protein
MNSCNPYLQALMLVERLHRRLLDVIKDEFDRRGRRHLITIARLRLILNQYCSLGRSK